LTKAVLDLDPIQDLGPVKKVDPDLDQEADLDLLAVGPAQDLPVDQSDHQVDQDPETVVQDLEVNLEVDPDPDHHLGRRRNKEEDVQEAVPNPNPIRKAPRKADPSRRVALVPAQKVQRIRVESDWFKI
jgi:hypothetical protein